MSTTLPNEDKTVEADYGGASFSDVKPLDHVLQKTQSVIGEDCGLSGEFGY